MSNKTPLRLDLENRYNCAGRAEIHAIDDPLAETHYAVAQVVVRMESDEQDDPALVMFANAMVDRYNQHNELTEQRDELLRDMQDVLDMLINELHAVTAANQAEDMLRLSIGTAKYFAKAGSENHSPDTAKMAPGGLPLVTDSCSALMTLEEAIAHADEKAIGNSQCAAQHAQLAKWLTDYRAMLSAAPKPEGVAA